jgi:hypothetical protein
MPVPQSTDKLQICDVCAHKNSAAQNFCGMCGAALQNSVEASPEQVADAVTRSAAHLDASEPIRDTDPRDTHPLKRALEPAASPIAVDGNEGVPESPWTRPNIPLPSFAMAAESEPADRRYRLYLGVVLALVLALLLYMARRGTTTIAGNPGAQSPASTPIPSAPVAEPTTSAQTATTATVPPETNPPESGEPREEQPAADSQENQPTHQPRGGRPSSPGLTIEKNSPATAAQQSGAEELTTAERYLKGVQGMPRDSREASLWLWKAVGKGNLDATVALSDLYLHGDGVPRSCDQARLLLDAAARKGGKAAAERLRNLQAFGCD